MKIIKKDKKGVCSCCKKVFDVGFEIDKHKQFFTNEKLCFNCAQTLYESLGKYFVPKAIKHIFNKKN